MIRKGKVIVAMSGGVDSSLAAALLKNRGYDVSGVFMRMHNKSNPKDAKIVAKKLGIRFKILNVQKEFKRKVVDYFISEYKKGRTPNPCVECNKHIKFKILFDKMAELKADYIATGHYVRIKNKKLLTAKDTKKDQTYFLWQLNQKQLSRILFPIGDYTKTQVREMAKKFGLQVYNKQDSQEICFISGNIRDFLKQNLSADLPAGKAGALAKAGPVFTADGKKVGEHDGLAFYTIGQRKGIEIGGIGPFYVVDKDFKKNALIVAQGDFNKALYKKEMFVKNVNWINKQKRFPFRCKVKIRYGHKAVLGKISKLQSTRLSARQAKYKVLFNAPQRAITPGQSAAFYRGNEFLGGGVID